MPLMPWPPTRGYAQEESDQNYAPEEAVEEEERLRKEREGANKEALQVGCGLMTSAKLHLHHRL